MKTVWTILSVLAVANLLALLAFVGWLKTSDRLDIARIKEVRALLAETRTARHARDEEARLKAEAASAAEEARLSALIPPLPAAGALELRLQQSEADQARLEAIRREVQILQETLGRERQILDQSRAALEAEREEFERARRIVAETEGNAQFKKTLATYEGLKADRAKAALAELISAGGSDQAVSYLNAMQERTRTRIIDEFINDDPKLAKDLLEQLRTRGMQTAATKG